MRFSGMIFPGNGVLDAMSGPVFGSRTIWFDLVRKSERSPVRQAAGATLAVEAPDVRCSVPS